MALMEVGTLAPTFNPAGQGGNTVTITFTPNAGLCAATQTMDIVVTQVTTPVLRSWAVVATSVLCIVSTIDSL
ncbi:MAG: hypothetical protein R2825_02705 [Saprospiraceae bacterium]